MKGNNIGLIFVGLLCMILILSYVSNRKINSAMMKVEAEWDDRVKYHRENKKKGNTRCHGTKKVVTSSEYNNRDDCLEQSNKKSCRLGDISAQQNDAKAAAKLEADIAIKTAARDCEGLMPKPVKEIKEDCQFVSPYLINTPEK